MNINKEFFRNNEFIIALDLDGTLLNDNKEICDVTAKYLIELSKLGNKIILCSGRSPRTMMKYYNQLNLDTPIISYNGGKISFPKEPNKKEISYVLPKKVIFDFINYFKEDSFKNVLGESDSCAYFLHENKQFPFFFDTTGVDLKIGSLNDTLKEDLNFIVIESHNTNRNKEMEDFFIKFYPDYSIRFWHDIPIFGEFFHYNVDKGKSLKEVSKLLKIPQKNVIAFGDAPNDIEMLKYANYSFAMDNGFYIIKENAKSISLKNNNDDGIYHSLIDLFNKLDK